MKRFKENVVRSLEVLKHLKRINRIKKCTRKGFTVFKSVRKIEPLYYMIKYREAKVDL